MYDVKKTTQNIKYLSAIISDKFTPKNIEADWFEKDASYLDPKIVPKIFAFSANGIQVQTNNHSYNGNILDFAGQTVTCLLGQNDPWVVANMLAFISSGHPSFLSTSMGQEIYYKTAKKIRDITKMGEDSFVNHRLNNGSDATDFAINIAYNHHEGKRQKLVSFKGSYHGQGHLPYAASGLLDKHCFFTKTNTIFLNNPTHAEDIYQSSNLSDNDQKIIDSLKEIGQDVFALIIEPVQFNNNGNTPSKIFLETLKQTCSELHIPLIFDEIQTGWGWLGKMTASEVYGVWPDIMAISKSITSGYGPLSAVIAKDKFRNTNAFGARTNGSDVRSLVAANAVMDRLLGTDDIPESIKDSELGEELQKGLLASFPIKHKMLMQHLEQLRNDVNSSNSEIKIGRIKGAGLARMIEIQDREGKFNSQLTKKLQHQILIEGGVFVRTPSNPQEVNTLFVKMPIVVTQKEMVEGFKRIKQVIVNFTTNDSK